MSYYNNVHRHQIVQEKKYINYRQKHFAKKGNNGRTNPFFKRNSSSSVIVYYKLMYRCFFWGFSISVTRTIAAAAYFAMRPLKTRVPLDCIMTSSHQYIARFPLIRQKVRTRTKRLDLSLWGTNEPLGNNGLSFCLRRSLSFISPQKFVRR